MTTEPKPPWWATKSKQENRKPPSSPKASALAKANVRQTSQFKMGEARREHFLECLAKGMSVTDAAAEVGVSVMTHRKWRQKYPEYAARVDAVRIAAARLDGATAPAATPGAMSFGVFRKEILETDSPWFHLEAVRWLEEAPPGSITLMLWPPEHGKTTLLEDFCTWKLSVDPNFRIGVGSERQAHSKKILARVMNRFDDHGPFPRLIERFGPFAPQAGLGGRKANQPWSSTHFTVFHRQNYDERDYSMTALGIGSGVVGSRMDLLLLDDVQSVRNLGQTDKILETIRQDWLSRPGSKGRTVIIGTRVGDNDVYAKLMDSDLLDKVILFRAHDADGKWLWPERYSPEEYARMRRNVGEAGWERNYMQRATVKGERTFTEEMIEDSLNPLRAVFHDPPAHAAGIVVGLDPGFGVNAIITAAVTSQSLIVLGGRVDEGLTSNQQIFDVVEQEGRDRSSPSVPWLHLIMEDKAFQRGLFGDEALRHLQTRYGFTVSGHQTGVNKYDPNLGIAAMARSFLRKEIELPGSDDPQTTAFRSLLVDDLYRWRPNARGNKLRQDMVMALWFAWLWWKRHRDTLGEGGAGDFRFGGLPYAQTRTGLVLPTGPYAGRT